MESSRPEPIEPILINRPLSPHHHDSPQEDEDIYRGSNRSLPHHDTHLSYDPPVSFNEHINVPTPSIAPSATSGSSSTSSSSSSSSRFGPGRALATIVERAITHWARSTASSDTSSSTSSSSSSSDHSSQPSRTRRRRRRTSIAASSITVSTPAQRAKAREALEQARRVPREFTLLFQVPPPSQHAPVQGDRVAPQRTIRTQNLDTILSELGGALKRSARENHPRKEREKGAKGKRAAAMNTVDGSDSPSYPDASSSPQYPLSAESSPPTQAADLPRLTITEPTPRSSSANLLQQAGPRNGKEKGKGKQPHVRGSIGATNLLGEGIGSSGVPTPLGASSGPEQYKRPSGERAWWLDVACPTWEDMRALGSLLHLHPLTLEDILQQDPREKLEVFSRLGYYFIAFRAIDPRFQATASRSLEQAAGDISVVNVYLTVFREGICSFHFADISEHAKHVMDKVLQLEESLHMSSDHIAHGLMDSMVDAFMPLMTQLGLEVEDVDSLVAGINDDSWTADAEEAELESVTVVNSGPSSAPSSLKENEEKVQITEKGHPSSMKPPLPSSTPSRSNLFSRLTRVLWRSVDRVRRRLPFGTRRLSSKQRARAIKESRMRTLTRMTATRRVVTTLVRLLAPKNEVLGQLRKRLILAAHGDGADLGAHLGDVQDHILTMQQSLTYYERVLSHSHPAYLSFLNVSLAQAKGGSDEIIFYLSTISIAVICMQLVLGVFSMNIHIPQNFRRDTSHPEQAQLPIGKFHWFGVVIVILAVVAVGVAALIRWWWVRSKRKYRARGLR